MQGLLSGYSLSVEMDILFVALCILTCPEDCFASLLHTSFTIHANHQGAPQSA